MTGEKDLRNLLGVLGLAARAGAIVCGTDPICDAMRAKKRGKSPLLVIASASCSANTQKKLADKCAYYKVDLTVIPVDPATLGRTVGKSGEVAAVAITEGGFKTAVEKQLGTER